ncbi:MAG: adenylosuccinate synthase [Bacilli bacterium]
MTQTLVVIGSQWGDEGKGKITNYLSEKADVVVRYQGGDNAGHTIVFGGYTYKLHLIPSGIFNPNTINICGNGMVINPRSLVREILNLKSLGYSCKNLYISDRAHVLFDHHQVLDELQEESLAQRKIGTTKKGIGPAYTDKVSRQGIRMADFMSEDFPLVYRRVVRAHNEVIIQMGGTPVDIETTLKEYESLASTIRPMVKDTIPLLHEAYREGQKILFEGAQGAMLDIDFGTYPYVTSSNPSSGGVAVGSGIGVTRIDAVLGIVKAYTTRVGEGPFPTELLNDLGDHIREVGHEFGTTTRRPRRIGWFDGVVLRYSAMINGMTGVALMLLDVLSGVEELKICTHYLLDGKQLNYIPARLEDYERCVPVYRRLPGWKEDITMVKSFDELPIATQNYIKAIEEVCQIHVQCFSVGPDREQTVLREPIF